MRKPGSAVSSAASAREETQDRRDQQRDVVLDAQALDLLRLADVLAQRPELPRLRIALRHNAIAAQTRQRRAEKRFDAVVFSSDLSPPLPTSTSTYQGSPQAVAARLADGSAPAPAPPPRPVRRPSAAPLKAVPGAARQRDGGRQ